MYVHYRNEGYSPKKSSLCYCVIMYIMPENKSVLSLVYSSSHVSEGYHCPFCVCLTACMCCVFVIIYGTAGPSGIEAMPSISERQSTRLKHSRDMP